MSVHPIGNPAGMKRRVLEVPHRRVGIVEEHRARLRVPVLHDGLRLVGACAIEVHRGADGELCEAPLVEADAWRTRRRDMVVVTMASDVLHLLVPPSTTADADEPRLRGSTGWKHEAPRKLMDDRDGLLQRCREMLSRGRYEQSHAHSDGPLEGQST